MDSPQDRPGPSGARPRPLRARTTDPWVKVLHALLAVAFLGAWVTAESKGLKAWHVASGHALAVAWLLRLAWSFAQPRASLMRWWRSLTGALRRWRAGRGGAWGPATLSVGGLASLVCAFLLLVPLCFVSGFALDRLAQAAPETLSTWHRWLGEAITVVAASHVALVAVLSVLRGRCMACAMLPGAGDRRAKSVER